MGAEGSKITSKAGDQYAALPKQEKKVMANAEKARGRRLSMKTKTKTEFLGDVTAYPDKQYTLRELEGIEKFLAKRLKKITTQIDQLKANKYQGFVQTYTGIKDGNSESSLASKMPEHKHLNRYNNIVAYDSSRVKVNANKHTNNTDYINANYIHGHGRANMYIASQGPVPDSQAAFWQMLWEQNVQMIVMVTGEVEGGKLKCHRYWPDDTEHGLTLGDFNIEMSEVEAHPTYIARCFQVTSRTTSESRFVYHYQYIAWPDHGVPETSLEMLRFRAVVKEKFDPAAGPMTVHCSAGVGRTGTFIGLDRYLDSCADLDDGMTVLDIVKDMRQARNFMVQAQAQFIYLYEAAKEGLSKLLEKVSRELRFAGFTGVQMEQAMLQEIEVDMTAEMKEFKGRLTTSSKVGGKADVKHTDGTTYTDDRHTASKVGPEQRIGSLAKSTDQWLLRNNVPMDPEGHGYRVQAAGLETRLSALSESRTTWMKVYSEAEKTWQSAQDDEGVRYDVGHQLTTIESRVMSLANAEAAWTFSGNGQNNVYDEMAAENLANLELRLQSLSYTVMTAEQRWKDRGHGFRGAAADKESIKAQVHASNSKYQGSLTDRLMSLQGEQASWQKRAAWDPYDKDKFFKEIGEEFEKQEQMTAKHAAEVKVLQKAMEATAAEKALMEQQKVARSAEQDAVQKNRKKADAVALKASVANKGEYLPHAEQMKKVDQKAMAEAKKLAEFEKKKETKRVKAEGKQKKLDAAASAKKAQSKYLKSQGKG